MEPSRRRFLAASTAAATGGLLGLDGLGFLTHLRPVSADEADVAPDLVRLDDAIEPTVRLLEDTPRDRLLEEVASRVRDDKLAYRELLAALLLAGVRNVQPRPHVGFKFHAVLVVNSAHLASRASPDGERWLPIFWALDYFKGAQATTRRESGWRMRPVEGRAVPADAEAARKAFDDAMSKWDEPAADAAAAGVARTMDRDAAFELFARYGPRDFRDIGHKAIYVANAFRTLDAIGWRHAEPVLRSLAYALLKHDGKSPAGADLPPDRPGRRNAELAAAAQPDWADRGKAVDDTATRDLLGTFRSGSEADAARQVMELVSAGRVAPQSVWDAVLCGAGEQVMRRPGIVALHAVTTSNALRYAYDASRDPQTRLLLLLQAASFLPLFRGGAGKADAVRVDAFEEAPLKATDGGAAVTEVFDEAGESRMTAARKALSHLKAGPRAAEGLITAARRLVFLKGNDSHDYKFSAAALEDYQHLSPAWRDRYLAASLFLLPTPADPDNKLVQRTRAALGG